MALHSIIIIVLVVEDNNNYGVAFDCMRWTLTPDLFRGGRRYVCERWWGEWGEFPERPPSISIIIIVVVVVVVVVVIIGGNGLTPAIDRSIDWNGMGPAGTSPLHYHYHHYHYDYHYGTMD